MYFIPLVSVPSPFSPSSLHTLQTLGKLIVLGHSRFAVNVRRQSRGAWGSRSRWEVIRSALVHTSGKLCVFPLQLESGGNMIHLKDLSTQAIRFGLLFRQVLRT